MPDRPVYLDNHATTPVDPRVLEAMLPYFRDRFGNAASVNHAYGWEAADAVEQARAEVASLLHVPPRSIVFTSGATEANNLAIKGVLRAAPAGSRIVTCVAEHRSVLDPVRRLKRSGYEVGWVGVDRMGLVDPGEIERALDERTVLVSIMLANNEVGTIQPLDEIGAICKKRGVLLHCDAVQAAGRIAALPGGATLDANALGIDLMSISAHKLYGPKGVGALFVRRGEPRIRIEPLFDGGGHEGGLRSGTLPVPLIVGFGAACRLARETLSDEQRRIADLRDRLWQGLCDQLEGLHLNGHPSRRLPGNLNISVEGVDGDVLMTSLTRIAVSSGSACTSADPEPSHVLRAMGVPENLTRSSLRFGLGRFNTAEEIEFAIDYVAETVRRLRARRR